MRVCHHYIIKGILELLELMLPETPASSTMAITIRWKKKGDMGTLKIQLRQRRLSDFQNIETSYTSADGDNITYTGNWKAPARSPKTSRYAS